MRRAFSIFEASLGDEHPHTGIVRANLAALLSAVAGQPEPGSED